MVQFVGDNVYPADTPPEWHWCEFPDNRFCYEERPRMIIHYWPPNHGWHKKNWQISAFVNMNFRPTEQDILNCMARAMKAANINAKISNLRPIYPEYGNGRATDKFFGADVEVIE